LVSLVSVGQQRWADQEAVTQQLLAAPQTAVEGAVLRARGQLARREFPAARQTLEKTIVDAPQALWPRVILTHVLLQEGRDWAAAERALRDVLDIAPNHAEARRNLAVLLRQQGGALAS
jgi:Tfp pilus assembly protein PilF